jgi:hypothetical protein
MLESSTPVLILGCKEDSLSVTRHLGSLGITVRVSGLPNCWDWPKIAATARHVFPLLRVSDPMSTLGTALAVPHHVTVK